MKILIHDYSGHAFPLSLSRWLAARGLAVLHLSCADFQTPKAEHDPAQNDPPHLSIVPLSLGYSVPKYRYFQRWQHERLYGALLAQKINTYAPSVVLSGNAPLTVQAKALAACRDCNTRFVFWMQDIVSDMAARILPRTYPLIGHLAAAYLRRKEFAIALDSAHVIAIAPAFAERCRQKGVPDSKLTMIPNWASLDDIAILPKHNDWRLTHNPLNRPMMLYAGTLGLKHDPSLLSDLAQTNPNALMIVVSEGMGRQWLEATKRSQNLDNLILMDYQPQSQVAAMVTAADLTIALLEPEAGGMSVPSKVLTYLAAGRPILSAIPPSNLAAKTIETAGAGHNFSPSNRAGFLAASRQMLNDPNNLDELGLSARRYAEQTFHMDQIGTRFLSVFQSCL